MIYSLTLYEQESNFEKTFLNPLSNRYCTNVDIKAWSGKISLFLFPELWKACGKFPNLAAIQSREKFLCSFIAIGSKHDSPTRKVEENDTGFTYN